MIVSKVVVVLKSTYFLLMQIALTTQKPKDKIVVCNTIRTTVGEIVKYHDRGGKHPKYQTVCKKMSKLTGNLLDWARRNVAETYHSRRRLRGLRASCRGSRCCYVNVEQQWLQSPDESRWLYYIIGSPRGIRQVHKSRGTPRIYVRLGRRADVACFSREYVYRISWVLHACTYQNLSGSCVRDVRV